MLTTSEIKEREIAETPLLLFHCLLTDGREERWSTHAVNANEVSYDARVLRHNVFEMQASSDQGLDAIPRISVVLANADGHFSELERLVGWKGAQLTASFGFFDARTGEAVSEVPVIFRGVANPPEEITESEFRLSAINRMSMQRVSVPHVRVQRQCPWHFPTTDIQRQEAAFGGNEGCYSKYYRCGYSPDVEGGYGSMKDGLPFADCGYTRTDCEARGMFASARRFGGIEFVPPAITVRSYGEKGTHVSPVQASEARYNDFVPLVYGTAWYSPRIVFARNDGNLTRMEVLLGIGEIQDVLKVVVADVEIPLGRGGTDMTGTGWFNVASRGTRSGAFNPDFTDSAGHPLGDPYGSMAYLSVVVPNRINDGKSLPEIKVLLQGLKLPRYTGDGTYQDLAFSNNPAWIILDLLRRSGWNSDEIDLASFATCAAYCDEQILTKDAYGNEVSTARFQCNLALQNKRSAADVIRGIRNGSRLFLTYGAGGLLQLSAEDAIRLQQPDKPAGSNSTETLNGGWPAYEFGDGSNGFSGILRGSAGESTLKLTSRSTVETPNRFAVEFQDAWNEYQQDSFSLTDTNDVGVAGQEITGPLNVLGLPNFNQAYRITRFHLDKAIRGNTYAEFETSVRGLDLRPGDLISLTYQKEGLDRQPFRVVKITPGTNYRRVRISAQIHEDAWYSDDPSGSAMGGRRQAGSGLGVPRPLGGSRIDEEGHSVFEISEEASGATTDLMVSFTPGRGVSATAPGIPLIDLAVRMEHGGTLRANQTLYYAITSTDQDGKESPLSFVVRATIPEGANDWTVILQGIGLPADAAGYRVYRGSSPAALKRVASEDGTARTFKDTGFAEGVDGPPDQNYDHANFYWRWELLPETNAAMHSPNSLGNESLSMPLNRYRGMVARIVGGRGVGQEREILSNTETEIQIKSTWTTEPDGNSKFVIGEGGWQFGASAKASPVRLTVPSRSGSVVEICGRSANINDAEATLELSPMTRWALNAGGERDHDVPPAPRFGLSLTGNGAVEVNGIAFEDLENTHSITAATLILHYFDELSAPTRMRLRDAIVEDSNLVVLEGGSGVMEGALVQIEQEVLRIGVGSGDGATWAVSRGIHSSPATTHDAGKPAFLLSSRTIVLPFVRDFFGSPYSGAWSYPIVLPDVRIAAAELIVFNDLGSGDAGVLAVTQRLDEGLRTLSGGQISFQIDGFLAIDSEATPDVSIDRTHAVREVWAMVKSAPQGGPIEVSLIANGERVYSLTIPDGETRSESICGFNRAALTAGTILGLEVSAVGVEEPGADLTVTVRF